MKKLKHCTKETLARVLADYSQCEENGELFMNEFTATSVFLRNITKENWYSYLSHYGKVDLSDPILSLTFKHDGDKWILYHQNKLLSPDEYTERFIWDAKNNTLEGMTYLPKDKKMAEAVLNEMFGL